MNDTSRVLVAIRVRASTARAFDAFTGQIAQWWRPDSLFVFSQNKFGTLVFEPGPEGRLIERYDDGTEWVVGDVRAWDPPHRLVVGWRQAGFTDEQDTELHVTFQEIPGDDVQTRVTVEHFGWDRIPPENAARHGFPLQVFQLRFAEWWQAQLQGFAAGLTPTREPGQSDWSTGSHR